MLQPEKNVIIAGSTKCGTTSLFRYLAAHPQICASLIKETRFFWNNDYELVKPKLNGKEVTNYSDFFPGCSNGKKWKLEATPDYLYSSSSAEKIKAELPDCKIIFILRDPLQRIISWYKFGKQTGRLSKDLQPDDYLKILSTTENSNSPQHLKTLEQGKYGTYLQPYFNLFNRENILVTFHKVLQNDPRAFMNDICAFLKIDPSFYDKFDFKVFNPSLNVTDASKHKNYVRLKKRIRSYNHKLPEGWRKFFKRIMKPVDEIYISKNSVRWNEIKLSPHWQKFIEEYYAEDQKKIEKILNASVVW